MSNMTSCELFAARGDQWNTPNYQHHVEGWYRRRHPDGTLEIVDRHLIDGYDVVPEPDRPVRAKPRVRFVDPPPPPPNHDARRLANALMRSSKNVRKAMFNARP